ncbi:Cys-tRNA(Pro)/Cys-tRNA(Cys) deacylase [Mobilisporobacter senegalensis]|uniref:Cys-tRNA(Pro)/Cys-tRNA(Cys) deacylase n=1 Tax=Mobilisporobacter senegalensis TaxID=1329262 RepID=A0A3N1XRH1_9FIRM|nr:Cys-tRNA(Pro) deacylase [Mobilisporobacter senegalensis]ROR29270.1 Cys-tRNA(Pro)/Cys-tRNA(Cys) deacylase [Mobilisporobacter senegalensis]
MSKPMKTNAMRLLDQARIEYRTMEYEVDEENLAGEHVAIQINMPAEQVFKTLIARGEKKGILVFCIPVNEELDLKKAAVLVGDKKIEMIHVKELLPLTGYIRGGCSPIGMKKKYPTYIDESAILFDEISVSAGVRGCQMICNPEDLIKFIEAIECDLTE